MNWLTPRIISSPERAALIWGDRLLTYRQLGEWARGLEEQFARAGIAAGQRVAALLPKTPAAVAAVHALSARRAVLVPLNLRLTPAEMAAQCALARVTHIVATEDTAEQARDIRIANEELRVAEEANEELRVAEGANEELRVVEIGSVELQPTNFATPNSQFAIPNSSPLALLFTSGTTGTPKAARLTTANFYWSALASAFRLGVLPHDRWLLTLPLYHVGGLNILFRSALYGTAVVLPAADTPFNPEWLYETMHRQRVTLVSLVPTMLHRLLEAVPAPPPPDLRLVLLGGAAAPPDLLARALARGYPVATTYGLTESCSQAATATPPEVRRKPGTVGKPLLYTQIRIVDENDRPLPPGEIGEIVLQGPSVFAGYDDNPQATARALRGGWLHTGDLGYLDTDGDLWVVNRRTDLIVSGGENVYPAEVEAVLRAHPAVAEACVVGVDDAEWGQRVAAAVVLHPQAQASIAELEAFCRQRLAGYKVPRLWRIMPDLPRTASGKVKRSAVRRLLSQENPQSPKTLPGQADSKA